MGHLVMSEKERLHKAVMEMVKQGKLHLNQAAEQCGLSYRRAKRIYIHRTSRCDGYIRAIKRKDI
jgi:hypothetical protein